MAAAESIVAKVRTVQSRIGVPFLLENISYAFEWPDSNLSDADFLNLICRESGAGLLLDIENLYLNSQNHDFDAYEFLDELSPDLVREVHMAGGISTSDAGLQRSFLADTHSHPVPNETLDLLQYALSLYAPQTIILERDDRLDATGEILADVERIRLCVDQRSKYVQGKGIVGSSSSPARIPD
jgi:uncharacterized protein (UPF0276 family)